LKAKSYSNQKYALSIFDTFFTIALILIFLRSGFSLSLEKFLASLGLSGYLLATIYLLAVLLLYGIFNFPVVFYSSFILEHKFNLTRQKLGSWLIDQIKSAVLGFVVSLILVLTFYFVIGKFGQWWLPVSFLWILFSVIFAKLTPILVIPLFFKYKKLEDQELRNKILDLAQRMKVKILDVYEIDFSKKTLKANAAFTGMGKTKRVLLADTLKGKYTHDEVEVILAHEFAHYQLKHIIKIIAFNSLITLGLFYLIFKTNGFYLEVFKLDSLSQPASLALIFLYFIIFGVITQPLEAFISRVFERQADSLALKVTGAKEAFISLMEKLAGQNLADKNPHPIIKFFFFDHPPIDERIKSVNQAIAEGL